MCSITTVVNSHVYVLYHFAVNMMVFGAGGYKPWEFFKIGFFLKVASAALRC